jgi:hypothetical protein
MAPTGKIIAIPIWKFDPMSFIVRPNIRTALVCASLVFITGTGVALAQSGGAGGSIGNDDKSVSGSRSPPSEDHPRSARRSHETEQPRRSARRSGGGGGGGGGNFDGTWAYTGVGTNCQGSGSGTLVISGGRISAPGTSGTVSSSGAYHTTGVGTDGLTYIVNGRMSAATGGGSFSRSDGCVGRWTALKQ